MDGSQFDELVCSLAGSRRSLMGGSLAGAAGTACFAPCPSAPPTP